MYQDRKLFGVDGDSETFAAFGTAAFKSVPAAFGGKAGTKAVLADAFLLFWIPSKSGHIAFAGTN